jgi:metal-responsive CopG/Arc/MetJ family transcriptional regulator
MHKEQTEAITLRIPRELLAEIDIRTGRRFMSRSDAIRSLLWQSILLERGARAAPSEEAVDSSEAA